jgi:hypothetical protein
MPKKEFLLFVLCILGSLSLYAPAKSQTIDRGAIPSEGENIVYKVKLNGLSLGTAVFEQSGKVLLGRDSVDFITFHTSVTSFDDMEKIYSDPQTYLPLRVERDIKGISGREQIREDYNQKNFTLTITKLKGGKKEEVVIKKTGPIYNAILLPFYVRHASDLDPGWKLNIQLPTQAFLIKLISIEYVKVPAGKFKCYRFESEPKRFSIWITADSSRIPVKIQGAAGLGYTLSMKRYGYKNLK